MPTLLELVDMRNPASLASRMRSRRWAFFAKLLATVPRPIRICDIGGTANFWENVDLAADDGIHVTVCNIFPQTADDPRVSTVVGDARALDFPDHTFDIAFSNSVIEHVGSFEDQRRMAAEIRRISKRHFVQTPNYFFPMEPHFLVPGFQYLPVKTRAWMLTKRHLGWIPKEPDPVAAAEIVSGIRLLRLGEFRRLFPDSHIYHERIGPLTKSFIAYGGFEPFD